MARGALKGLKRNRPTPGEKVVVKGQLSQGTGGRSPAPSVVSTSANGEMLGTQTPVDTILSHSMHEELGGRLSGFHCLRPWLG